MTRAEYIIDDDFLDDETKMSAESQGFLWGLIRCKDCKYYQQGSRNPDDWLWCMMNHHYTDEEKYCAWAERKEG